MLFLNWTLATRHVLNVRRMAVRSIFRLLKQFIPYLADDPRICPPMNYSLSSIRFGPVRRVVSSFSATSPECSLTIHYQPERMRNPCGYSFGAESGMFVLFLLWDPPDLEADPDEPTASVPSQTAVLELAKAYTLRYRALLICTLSLRAYSRLLRRKLFLDGLG